MFNVSSVWSMSNYVPIEYPKWVDGVVVRNVEEEQARREALEEAAAAVRAAELARPPSPAGIRMRRTRERRRAGKMSIRVDVSVAQIEFLASSGFINPRSLDDPTEVARSVCCALDCLTWDGATL
jgi:hypothetical protein